MIIKHQLDNSQITEEEKNKEKLKTKSDVILIGAGIMSATLGILLKELEPNLTITVLERLDAIRHFIVRKQLPMPELNEN